jgi:hypothetical protein
MRSCLRELQKNRINQFKIDFFVLPDTGHMGMIESETLALKKMIEFVMM